MQKLLRTLGSSRKIKKIEIDSKVKFCSEKFLKMTENSVTEGLASIHVTDETGVFYNPVQQFNRDMSKYIFTLKFL